VRRVPGSFIEAWQLAAGVDGWLTEAQGRSLYLDAGTVPEGRAIVEIGSHRGKSTILLASGMRSGVRLTAVDPFDDPRWGGGPESLSIFEANLVAAGVRDRVELFRGLSKEAAASWSGEPVGLAWIDGAHDRGSVLEDIEGWDQHLVDGGLMVLHDAFSAIVTTEAVLQRLWWSRDYRYLGCERTLVRFRKERRDALGVVVDAIRLAPRLVFFARMVAIKLARRRRLGWLERALMRGDNEPLI
jgi:predicted O-methyltransferase YrrM